MKFRQFKRNDKEGTLDACRDGASVRVYKASKDRFDLVWQNVFPTVSAAKAWMNRPSF